jgi:hypothetical protein
MGTPHFAASSFNLFKRSPPALPAVLFYSLLRRKKVSALTF